MKITLADVKKVHFEEELKTYLMSQLFLPDNRKDRWHKLTPGARAELRLRVSAYSEGTRQLILRSNIIELVEFVVRLGNEKDIMYMVETGNKISYLTCAPDDVFKKVIPDLLDKYVISDRDLAAKIVRNHSDLTDLFNKCKDKQPQVLSCIQDEARCPVEIFVEIFNKMKGKKDVYLGYRIRERLEHLLLQGQISVSTITEAK